MERRWNAGPHAGLSPELGDMCMPTRLLQTAAGKQQCSAGRPQASGQPRSHCRASLHAGLHSAVTEHAGRAHLPDVCRQLPHEHLSIQRTPKLMLQSICEELSLAATLDDGDRYPLGQLQGAAASLLQMQTERYAESLAGPGDTPAAELAAILIHCDRHLLRPLCKGVGRWVLGAPLRDTLQHALHSDGPGIEAIPFITWRDVPCNTLQHACSEKALQRAPIGVGDGQTWQQLPARASSWVQPQA